MENIDLYHFAENVQIYPKIFWQDREEKKKRVLLGSLITSDNIPILKGNFPSSFPPRFYGGRAFPLSQGDSFPGFPKEVYLFPEIEILFSEGKTYRITYRLDEENRPSFPKTLSDRSPLSFRLLSKTHFPDSTEWNEKVMALQEDLRAGKARKTVLARRTSLVTDPKISPFLLLQKIEKFSQHRTYFCFQFSPEHSFAGATPERIFSRKGQYLETEALAGTTLVANSKNLLESSKEMDEYQYVVDDLSKKLNFLATSVQRSENTEKDIGTVRHIYSTFRGILKKERSDTDILDILHPTPAICGTSREQALSLLTRHENFDRGWYAGAVGTVSPEETNFMVGIRSFFQNSNRIDLYIGNGITEYSDPEEEWNELEIKALSFFQALEEYGKN